jgi:hypothetical protein
MRSLMELGAGTLSCSDCRLLVAKQNLWQKLLEWAVVLDTEHMG